MADEIDGSDGAPTNRQPIFILGILPRSGTNFLRDLLRAHPDCGPPERVWEDFFVYHADLLCRYVDKVCAHWTPRLGIDDALRDRLYVHLGSGVISFLTELTDAGRVVTKTPRVENLGMFFKLFPDAHLLILVRDGRAVVESAYRSFRWYRELTMHRWAKAAQTILEFDRANKDSSHQYQIVRYEDLWHDLEGELRRILGFLGLDPSVYDFEAAARLPVRGSSSVRKRRDEPMHWDPVKKTPEFDPISRWRHWSRARHERFNWVAGTYHVRLGYEQQRSSSNRVLWALWNLVLDVRWLAIRTLGPAVGRWILVTKRRLEAWWKRAVRRRFSRT